MPDTLEQTIAMIKAGDTESGRRALRQILRREPDNEKAWLWLSSLTETDQERYACLERVLAINPENKAARRGLRALNDKALAAEPAQAVEPETTLQAVESPRPAEAPPTGKVDRPAPALRRDSPAATLQVPRTSNGSAQPVKTTVVLDEDALRPAGAPEAAHPGGAYDAFISYSRKDKPFVQKLYERLAQDGREIWIDWGNIPVTADWRREIREGIERANAVVFVMSPDFLASKECLIELQQAEEFNKRLIPIVYRDVEPKETPQSLASLNWLFFRGADDFERAFQALRQALETDLEWVKEHTRLLVRAIEWERAKRNRSFLLHGDDLREAELKVAHADKNPSPTPLQKQYILASRQDAMRRQKMLMARVTIGLVISIVLAIIALIQYQRADAAQHVAEQQRDQAAQQARIALSRHLGAEAIIFSYSQPDLAALLSLEAGRIANDDEIIGDLLASLRQSPYLVTILHGHTANVRSVAFNPTGNILASGSKDQTIVLWDMARREPLGPPLAGHTDRVSRVAFSPDGKILASASRDKTIRLWEVESRQPLGEALTGHSDWVNSVAFSRDGRILASGSSDQTIILWDVASRRPLGAPLTGHSAAVNILAFSPDGKILASGGDDKQILLWDLGAMQAPGNRQPLGPPLTGHTGWINDLAFSPDGQTLASGSSDRAIRLWDMGSGEMRGVPFTGHPTAVTAIAFSPDGQVLASGSEDDTVILWEARTGQQLGWPLRGHANSVLGLAFSPKGDILVSASSDASIGLWDVSAARFMVGHTGVVRDVAFSPDGQIIASGSSDHTVRLWDAATLQPLGEPLADHRGPVYDVAFGPDGRLLASGSQDGTIVLREAKSGQAIAPPLTGHQGDVWGIAFSPDSQILASAGSDQQIRLWDVNSQQILKILEGHTASVNQIAFSPDGKLLAAGDDDKNVMIWDMATGQPRFGRLTGHLDAVASVAFSPDGKTLASGGNDNLVILWDTASGQEVGELEGHLNRVTSVAFSPDGKTLASGSYDTNILLWDVATRRPLGPPLIGHTNDVNSLAWHPNGQALVSGSWDDTLMLWKLDFRPWAERACRIANRNLTEREQEEVIGAGYQYHPTCPGQ